jgi:hypothetical protein
MKKLILSMVLALVASVSSYASNITFVGVVDSSNRFTRGQTITFTFSYPPGGGAVSRYVFNVGLQYQVYGSVGGGQVAVGNNPASGSVYYQVINSDFTEITMQAATPNGVIPPVSQFNLNDFILHTTDNDTTTGHFLIVPIITG